MTHQECRFCHETKPLDAFPNNKRYPNNKDNRCRECMKDYTKENKIRRQRAIDDGILYEGAECPICLTTTTMDYKKSMKHFAVVDHCHETGETRGVLCSTCNGAIGKIGDSLQAAERAVEYLKGSTCSHL